MTQDFYYLRHGTTTDNLQGIISGGDRDVGLTDEARSEASRLAPLMAELAAISTICCSPMARGRETAALVNQIAQKPVVIVPELREWMRGVWAGQPEKDYKDKLFSWTDHPPHGETGDQFIDRIRLGLHKSLEQKSDVLIVAHAGVWRAIARILKFSTEQIPNCVFQKVSYTDCNGWRYAKLVL